MRMARREYNDVSVPNEGHWLTARRSSYPKCASLCDDDGRFAVDGGWRHSG
jgi:hypothetical protein